MVAKNNHNSVETKESAKSTAQVMVLDKSTVAEKVQNLEDTTQAKDKSNNNKNNNVVAGEIPSCWKFLSKCIINMTGFLEKAKSYAHQRRWALGRYHRIRKKLKRKLSVFVADKRLFKICCSLNARWGKTSNT